MKENKIREEFSRQDDEFLHKAREQLRDELIFEQVPKYIHLKKKQLLVIKEILNARQGR